MCIFVGICLYECSLLWKLEEDVGFFGVGIIGYCELFVVDGGKGS